MSSVITSILLVLCAVGAYFATPVAIIWGWVRWAKRTKQRTLPAILSLAGFILATASALFAIFAVVYTQASGLVFYDPQVLRIYRWGCLLSLGGIAFSISGVWSRSPLRWLAPACSAGTLLFWLMAMTGE